MAMNPGLAKYLAEKKAGTLPPKNQPAAPAQQVGSGPFMGQTNVQLMGAAPHGKRHSKVHVKPHKK